MEGCEDRAETGAGVGVGAGDVSPLSQPQAHSALRGCPGRRRLAIGDWPHRPTPRPVGIGADLTRMPPEPTIRPPHSRSAALGSI